MKITDYGLTLYDVGLGRDVVGGTMVALQTKLVNIIDTNYCTIIAAYNDKPIFRIYGNIFKRNATILYKGKSRDIYFYDTTDIRYIIKMFFPDGTGFNSLDALVKKF